MSAIETVLRQPAAQAIGWALLHFVWQGALVAMVTAVALAFLRRSAADVRYVVSAVALSVMLTLPAVTAVQIWQSSADREAVSLKAVASEIRLGDLEMPAGQGRVDPVRLSAGSGGALASRSDLLRSVAPGRRPRMAVRCARAVAATDEQLAVGAANEEPRHAAGA